MKTNNELVDVDGNAIELGSYVWVRVNYESSFDSVGIISDLHKKYDSVYVKIISSQSNRWYLGGTLSKFTSNLKKMTIEEASLAILEQ